MLPNGRPAGLPEMQNDFVRMDSLGRGFLPPSLLGIPHPPCGTPKTVAKSAKSAQWVETHSIWRRYETDSGRPYYHHAASKTTQWEQPTGWRGDIGDSPALVQKMAKKPSAAQLERVRIVASQAGVTQNGVGSTKPGERLMGQPDSLFASPSMHSLIAAAMQREEFQTANYGNSFEPVICEFCWRQDGQHKKKCPNFNIQETPEQKARRLKREERMRDQDLGAEYIDAEKQAEKTFTDYTPARLSGVSGLKSHPDPVTETSAFNSIKPPPITYKIKIPRSVILGGLLTDLQLEAILYACDQHERMLPCDKTKGEVPIRAGFFMGDGPGVGKGRQIAGIVLENFLRGREKAVWISVGPDLLEDARRDLRDIGAGAIPVHDLKNHKVSKKLSQVKECAGGVLFSTYTLLALGIKAKVGDAGDGLDDKSRVRQIVEWCGPEFDGVIAFDEAHKAKNMTMKGPSENKEGSKRARKNKNEVELNTLAEDQDVSEAVQAEATGTASAQAVIMLQKLLPNARVVYVSATGASEPEHLLYASRLGLWGTGTAFADPSDFAKEINEGGPVAMELLAMQMKQSGKYLARALSFKGATFEVVDVELSKQFEDMYDASVELWTDLVQSFTSGFKKHDKNVKSEEGKAMKKKISSVTRQMWGAHQRFFGQLLMAAKVDETVRLTQEAVDEGKCVVIGLQNTGEAGLTDEEMGDNGCSAADHVLRNLLLKNGQEFIEQDKVRELLKQLDALKLPINPLDDIIDRLGGPRRVAEMTGRKTRQVCEHGEWVFAKRIKSKDSEDGINIEERKKFMAGKKFVAIISDAASTGISLQADRRVQNDRRRVHITLQLPWSADKAVQQMGRSHRSNQSSAPEFKLLMTPIGGEWRFASAVAERLQQLGAITQGDRRATGGAGLTSFAVDSTYGMKAVEEFSQSVRLKRPWRGVDVHFLQPDTPVEDFEKRSDKVFAEFAFDSVQAFHNAGLKNLANTKEKHKIKVNQFLNKLLGLKLKLQSQVFSYWHLIMAELIRDAKKTGQFQEGIVDISSELNLEEALVLFEDERAGLATCLNRLVGDRGVSWEKAKTLMKEQEDSFAGFYRATKDEDGKRLRANKMDDPYNIFLALEKKQMVRSKSNIAFTTVEPHSGFRPDEISRSELRKHYEKLDDQAAEKKWKHVYDLSKHKCACEVCDDPATCELKKRTRAYNILTGSVLPFWKTIKSYMVAQEDKEDEDKVTIKVVRVQCKDNRRLVGILIPNENAAKIQEQILLDARELLNSGAFSGTVPDLLDSHEQRKDASMAIASKAKQEPVHMPMLEDAMESSAVSQSIHKECVLASGNSPAVKTAAEIVISDDVQDEPEELLLEAEDDSGEVSVSLITLKGADLNRGDTKESSKQNVVSRESSSNDLSKSNDLRKSNSDLDSCMYPRQAVTSAPLVLAANQDARDDTEDESDGEVVSMQTEGGNTQVNANNFAFSCQRVSANQVDNVKKLDKSGLRDSILSNSDTPQKDVIAHQSEMQGENEVRVDAKMSEGKAAKSVRNISYARLQVNTDGLRDGQADNEMIDHDSQTKRELKNIAQAVGLKENKRELESAGFWENDDDAEEFFKEGLKIMDEARRKDGSIRRRYIPSKDKIKSCNPKKPEKSVSRLGRTRKKTQHFASGVMKGQRYMNDGDDTEDDDGGETQTESDEDDDAFAKKSCSIRKSRAGPRSAQEGDGSRLFVKKNRQDASAVMLDKALKEDAESKKVRFHQTGKEKLKEIAKSFLGGLLCRPEMTGTMAERQVKQAIRNWIPGVGGVGEAMRGSDTPGKNLSVPKERLKREIKVLHPSCSDGTLKSLSNKGIRRVEAILGFFCQALVQQVAGFALSRGTKTISDEYLLDADKGIENLRDPTLRKLLQLEALPVQIFERLDHDEGEKQRADGKGKVQRISAYGCRGTNDEKKVAGVNRQAKALIVPLNLKEEEVARKLVGKESKQLVPVHGNFDGCIESFDPVNSCFKVKCNGEEEAEMDLEKNAQHLKSEDREMVMELKNHSTGEMDGTGVGNAPSAGNETENQPRDCQGEETGGAADNAEVGLVVLQERIRGSSLDPSDDEGDKTESETELDEDEHEINDEQNDTADAALTEDDWEMEEQVEMDDDAPQIYAPDDFRNRSHYCDKKCKLQNQYRADEHMLCCESCDVWFHGKCLGYTEGDIGDEQVWVCSENCFDDLPISQRKSDVVIGGRKRQYKKREPKPGIDKSKTSEKKERVKQGKEIDTIKEGKETDTSKEVETEDEEEEMAVLWSEDFMPHFQSVVEEAPNVLDTWLVGRTIMHQLSTPAGWFPAKIKKKLTAVKSKSKTCKFLLTYTHKATKGLMKGEFETLLDISEYGKEGRGKWVLLHERQMPTAEPEKLYCKKSCRHGRDNGTDHFMIFCEGCTVWFHGSCVGVDDSDVKEDDVWVCCQKCKYDLPRNLRSEALVGNSFKKLHEAGTACVAKTSMPTFNPGKYVADDSEDDDIPLLQRVQLTATRTLPSVVQADPKKSIVASDTAECTDSENQPAMSTDCKHCIPAAKEKTAEESDEDEPVVTQANSTNPVMMKILEPLASFVGAKRMTKKQALSTVLEHIQTGANGKSLLDPDDRDYVLADARLKRLIGNRTRVKLRKLAKHVAKYIVDGEVEDEDNDKTTVPLVADAVSTSCNHVYFTPAPDRMKSLLTGCSPVGTEAAKPPGQISSLCVQGLSEVNLPYVSHDSSQATECVIVKVHQQSEVHQEQEMEEKEPENKRRRLIAHEGCERIGVTEVMGHSSCLGVRFAADGGTQEEQEKMCSPVQPQEEQEKCAALVPGVPEEIDGLEVTSAKLRECVQGGSECRDPSIPVKRNSEVRDPDESILEFPHKKICASQPHTANSRCGAEMRLHLLSASNDPSSTSAKCDVTAAVEAAAEDDYEDDMDGLDLDALEAQALGIAEPIPNRTFGEDKGREGSSPAASHLVSRNDSWDDDDDGLDDLSPEALANLERLALGLPAL